MCWAGQAGSSDSSGYWYCRSPRSKRQRAPVPGAGDGVGVAGEEAGHLVGGLEVAVAAALAAVAGVVDGAALADAGHHVLQDAAAGVVVQHVAGGDQGHAGGVAELLRGGAGARRRRAPADGAGEVGAAGRVGAEAVEPGAEPCRRAGRRRGRRRRPSPPCGQVVPVEQAAALAGAALAQGEQAAEAGPGGAVGGVGEEGGAVAQVEPAAGDQADAGGAGRRPRRGRCRRRSFGR